MMLNELAYGYPALWYALLGTAGLLIGSFLNVVAWRLPVMLNEKWQDEARLTLNMPSPARQTYNLCWPPSACCSCQRPLMRRDLLPIVSWCLSGGKSRCCQQAISLRYPLVESICGALFVLAGLLWPPGMQLAAGLLLISALLTLAVIDATTLLLPDVLTLPLLWIGLLVNLNGCFVPLQDAVAGALCGYLSFALLSAIFTQLSGKAALGGGDAKLLAALGAWLGWEVLPQLVMVAGTGGLLGAGILHLLGRQKVNQPLAFGPWLTLSAGYFLTLTV
ncbi:prepilin peptidase [Buttiauxella warmboldiae]|uniref:Prepilin leader peptidase/N-methyltransferase n=1 Tax=Buttiauxella warmboldiae TaxID=82993 RepID=A0A3N5DNV6_9ENTR|nr:A24 family peptidase [Buttiauxella warmboldiae]RPH30128.1 prepilin peptidase [Buttiauxella warmboldiae]